MGFIVKKAISAEKIRDGGSFAAKFVSDDEVLHVLFFPITKTDNETMSYSEPYVIVQHGLELNIEKKLIYISWNDTLKILYDIFCNSSEFNFFNFGWLKCMCFIAMHNGHCSPPDFPVNLDLILNRDNT